MIAFGSNSVSRHLLYIKRILITSLPKYQLFVEKKVSDILEFISAFFGE